MRKAVVEIMVGDSPTPEKVNHYGCVVFQDGMPVADFAGQLGVVHLPAGVYMVRGFAFTLAATDEAHPTNEDCGSYIDQELVIVDPWAEAPSAVNVNIIDWIDE
jgi:hypothetical protein